MYQTKDGRIQGKTFIYFFEIIKLFLVGQRKVVPHVLYCKMFRFPKVANYHQLRQIPEVCSHASTVKNYDRTSLSNIITHFTKYKIRFLCQILYFDTKKMFIFSCFPKNFFFFKPDLKKLEPGCFLRSGF